MQMLSLARKIMVAAGDPGNWPESFQQFSPIVPRGARARGVLRRRGRHSAGERRLPPDGEASRPDRPGTDRPPHRTPNARRYRSGAGSDAMIPLPAAAFLRGEGKQPLVTPARYAMAPRQWTSRVRLASAWPFPRHPEFVLSQCSARGSAKLLHLTQFSGQHSQNVAVFNTM